MVDLGIGAFHRSHQAVYTEDAALAAGDLGWGICGVMQRSASVRDQLAPQDGLYGILQGDADVPASLRITGIVREVLDGPTQPDDVLDPLADPAVAVVTLTVSEKGYRRGPDGRLDLTDPLVRADIEGVAPASAVGRLVRGLQRRRDRDAGPVTVLCCDNLNHNGTVVEALVGDSAGPCPRGRATRWPSGSASTSRSPVRWSTASSRRRPPTTAVRRSRSAASTTRGW